MQKIYGHIGNLDSECADHAAELGTFGLIFNHNVAKRTIGYNFDASLCFDGCDNISEILERLQHCRTKATSFHPDKGLALIFLIGFQQMLDKLLSSLFMAPIFDDVIEQTCGTR